MNNIDNTNNLDNITNIENTTKQADKRSLSSIKNKIYALSGVALLSLGGLFTVSYVETNNYSEIVSKLNINTTILKNQGIVDMYHDALRADAAESLNVLLSKELTKNNNDDLLVKKIKEISEEIKKRKEAISTNLTENEKLLKQINSKVSVAEMKNEFSEYLKKVAELNNLVNNYLTNETFKVNDEATNALKIAEREKIINIFNNEVSKLFDKLELLGDKNFNDLQSQSESFKSESLKLQSEVFMVEVLVGLTFLILLLGFAFYVSKDLNAKIKEVLNMVAKISKQDMSVRYSINSKDEMSDIGEAIEKMAFNIDELETKNQEVLEKTLEENKKLNDSIISLLEVIFELSQKNLTVRAFVDESVVGTVADSINLFVSETEDTLLKTAMITSYVKDAASQTEDQATNMYTLSTESKEVTLQILSDFENSLTEISKITEIAKESKLAADKATESTTQALNIVKTTVASIDSIKETISNAETKIKKLAERSQEIGFIVDLIGDISERTHVLALNATIQAAVAGEAGRGFATIAEEIQKLAENTKDATNKIARLVESIQVETSETIQIVNKTIETVVQGVLLAQKSGNQMDETQENTIKLANFVNQISEAIQLHKEFTNHMKDDSQKLEDASNQFSDSAQGQLAQARTLLAFSDELQQSLNQFKLSKKEE